VVALGESSRSVEGGCELDLSKSGWRPEEGSCEHSIELSNSIKGEEFLEWLTVY
jgi:hypothetical protein